MDLFGAGTSTWQDPVHSWKAGPGEVTTVENKQKKSIDRTLAKSTCYWEYNGNVKPYFGYW
jgi:hypothetical protein